MHAFACCEDFINQSATDNVIKSSKRSEDINKQEAEEIMKRVYVEHGFDTGEDLMNRLISLESLLSTSLNSHNEVKLLVIDSIANLFRDLGDDDKASFSLVGRSMVFFRISSLLRFFAEKYNLAVVVTNHVVDAFHLQAASSADVEKTEASPGCGGLCLMSSGRAMYPALGLAWSNCITSRLFVFRVTQVNNLNELCRVLHSASDHERKKDDKPNQSLSQVRGIQVVFCPRLAQSLCYFTLHHGGRGVIGLLPKEVNESTNFVLSPMDSYAI
eukprot:jgi/Picsp_1/1041/NSC_04525-R1_dna repair protein xrcc3-like protein